MLRDKVANKLADIAIYRPKVVIGVFAVLTLVSLVLAGSISVLASTDELLGEDNPAGQRFTEITDNFGSTGTLVVAIEGPDRQTMIDAAHRTVELTERREQIMQHVRAIDLTVDPDYALEWGLVLSDDASDIEDVQTLLAQRSLVDFLTAVNDRYENVVLEDDDQFATNQDEWEGAQALAGIELFTRTLEASVAGKPLPPDIAPEHSPDRDDNSVRAEALIHTFFAGDAYSWSPEGDMLTFTIRPNFPLDDLDATGDTVYGLREVAAEVEQEMDEVRIGIGGEIAQNQDEQDAISADMLIPSVVALILIVALFAFSFAKFRNIFFAIISLIVGILLTVGGIAVTVGHLSFITSIFAVILIGLGIDFGIHLVSNYDDFREKGYAPATAIRKVMHAGGTPIMLGGITTAAAFFTLAVARMPAIAEFGIIAGMGVLLTLAAMMLLLPALMLSFGGRSEVGSLRRRFMINYGFMAAIGGAVVRHRIVTIALVAAATVFAATMIPQNRIDYDMMNIGPSSGPAVDTQRRIMDRMEVSPFTAITTTDSVEEARELADRLKRENLVSRVASISDLLPPEAEIEDRLEAIAASGPDADGGQDPQNGAGASDERNPGERQSSGDGPSEASLSELDRLTDEIQRLEWNIIELGDLAVAGLGEENRVVRRRDRMIREIIGAEVGEPGREVFQNAIDSITVDREASAGRLAALDAQFASAMRSGQQRMQVDRAPTVDDIPESIRDNFVSEDGTQFLTTVVPVAETHDSDEVLLAYYRQISSVDPAITGSVPLFVALVDDVFTDGSQAALWAALVVFAVMLAIFRRVGHVLLAFGSVAVAIVWMFGILPLLGMRLQANAAMVFPLLIGIGTDFAMHILHRYDHEGGDIVSTLRYSGKAVLLSSVTTMLGFGSLALVGQVGMISALGTLLFVGIAACLVATVVALPAFLGIGKRAGYSETSNS